MILRKTVTVTVVSESTWPDEYDKGWTIEDAIKYEEDVSVNDQLTYFIEAIEMSTKMPATTINIEVIG